MQTGKRYLNTRLKTGWMGWHFAAGCFLLAMALAGSALAATGPASKSAWFVDMAEYAGSAHGTLKCEECHGPMIGMQKSLDGVTPAVHPDKASENFLKKSSRRSFDYQVCAKCHKSAHDRFKKGEHEKAAIKEKEAQAPSKTGYAPNCGDCHSSHYAKSHRSRATIGREMTDTCGSCHPGQKQSFLANYHGKAAVNLGYDKAAFCTDCHGAHTALSLKDKEQALNACKRCHVDAGPEFANIIIHAAADTLELKSDAKKSGLKWVHWLGTLSLVFVTAVLAFFYMHTGLLMLRKLHEKLRRHK